MTRFGTRLSALLASVGATFLGVGDGAAQNVFEMQQLTPNAYAALVLPRPDAYAFANSLIVIGDDGVLVIDTQQSLTAARALIGEIARITSAPVRWVVNTHWHGDHVNGNQVYAETFPGVQFIAHPSLESDLDTLAARRPAELTELEASIEQRAGWLASDRGPDGNPLTAEQREAITRSHALRQLYLSDLLRTDVPPLTRTVSERMTLDIGGEQVELIHAGPAHTRGDVIVSLPGQGIVAVGDLLEDGMPWFGDSYPAGWLRVVERIAQLNARIILPSHGGVVRDGALIADTRQLLKQVVRAAARPSAVGDDDAAQEQTLAFALLQAHWERVYGVSAAAFAEGFRTAVQRRVLERSMQRTRTAVDAF